MLGQVDILNKVIRESLTGPPEDGEEEGLQIYWGRAMASLTALKEAWSTVTGGGRVGSGGGLPWLE